MIKYVITYNSNHSYGKLAEPLFIFQDESSAIDLKNKLNDFFEKYYTAWQNKISKNPIKHSDKNWQFKWKKWNDENLTLDKFNLNHTFGEDIWEIIKNLSCETMFFIRQAIELK